MLLLASSVCGLFKWRQFEPEVILLRNKSKKGREFADSFKKAHLLIDHPHSYRDWDLIAPADVPGFYHLESHLRLNPGEQPALYTIFTLCLHESEFERI
jgi:hypothetical protein